MSTSYSVDGRVAVIRIDNPPVNGLGHAVREGILRDRAALETSVGRIVLTDGRLLLGGADIRVGRRGSAIHLTAVIRGGGCRRVVARSRPAFGWGWSGVGDHKGRDGASRVGLPE